MRPARFRPPLILALVALALADVAHVLAGRTIAVVNARALLPRWDLATHLERGWTDYHLLVTGQLHRLVWDLWMQGYWPPLLSIYQVPFYVVTGGSPSAGLWAAIAVFVLVGVTGSAIILEDQTERGVAGVALFAALLSSSPFLLAYGSVAMTEMFGAWGQLLVLLAYVRYRKTPAPRRAALFAMSLSALFFIKSNYFVLLAVPLAIHEWLERTRGWGAALRVRRAARWAWLAAASPIGIFAVLCVLGVAAVLRTGGFDARVFGQRISVHSIGNSGTIALYVVLIWLWSRHRRGRIPWAAVVSRDALVRPLLRWFVLPVTIWLASPYPNHTRDVFNLVFNHPIGDATAATELGSDVAAVRTAYFFAGWTLAATVAVFVFAAFRYRRQHPVMRVLLIAIPIQLAGIALHQTRAPRFLVPTMVLLCLAASYEAGAWIGGRRLLAHILAAVIGAAGLAAVRVVTSQDRFHEIAFENYVDSASLCEALASIRADLHERDRLAIVGQGDAVSPALFRRELGPAAGVACTPFELGGAQGIDIARTNRVLLLEPASGESQTLDRPDYYVAQRARVLDLAAQRTLIARRDIPLPDLGIVLRLYDRTVPPDKLAPCR